MTNEEHKILIELEKEYELLKAAGAIYWYNINYDSKTGKLELTFLPSNGDYLE